MILFYFVKQQEVNNYPLCQTELHLLPDSFKEISPPYSIFRLFNNKVVQDLKCFTRRFPGLLLVHRSWEKFGQACASPLTDGVPCPLTCHRRGASTGPVQKTGGSHFQAPLLCRGPDKPCALITQLCLSSWAFYQRVIKMRFLNFKSNGSFSHLSATDKSRCGDFDYVFGSKHYPLRLSQRQPWTQSKSGIALCSKTLHLSF